MDSRNKRKQEIAKTYPDKYKLKSTFIKIIFNILNLILSAYLKH